MKNQILTAQPSLNAEAPKAPVSGHDEYVRWRQRAGLCFSPLTPSKERHTVGRWQTWTVEGCYQGLKRIRVLNRSLVADMPEAKWIEKDDIGWMVHFPTIMDVRKDLIRHPLFKLLKSGKRYTKVRKPTPRAIADQRAQLGVHGHVASPRDGRDLGARRLQAARLPSVAGGAPSAIR